VLKSYVYFYDCIIGLLDHFYDFYDHLNYGFSLPDESNVKLVCCSDLAST